MKNMKFFVISAAIVALAGISIVVLDNIKTKDTTVSVTQTDKITVSEPENQNLIIDGNMCLKMYFTKTTETKDGVITGEYKENVFGCFCAGTSKAVEGFEFKTSDSVAGETCDKQCAELCQKQK